MCIAHCVAHPAFSAFYQARLHTGTPGVVCGGATDIGGACWAGFTQGYLKAAQGTGFPLRAADAVAKLGVVNGLGIHAEAPCAMTLLRV